MGGLFGVVSKESCVMDLFFGTDYHSHLGTKRGGLSVFQNGKFNRSIHNIENSPFRTKFERDIIDMEGNMGIGCISDTEPQPLTIRSALGTYCICTVGRINNKEEIIEKLFSGHVAHFLEMSSGEVNATELVAALINQCTSIAEGIHFAQTHIDGSMTILVLTAEGLYAARDLAGRTPLIIGQKDGAFCASFESFAYLNLGYRDYKILGAGEIAFITPEKVEIVREAEKKKKVCAFLWTYYGYPASSYEGVGVEEMRYRCGSALSKDDNDIVADSVAGVPDSGIAAAIGYANESGIPFARPFIKYTPTWPRSFMPADQRSRNLIAKMKMIPVDGLIRGKKLIFIDDSIVRGTQLRETVDFLYDSGAKEVHIRPACPPIMFGCKYLNFSRSTSLMDLITRRAIREFEGDDVSPEIVLEYCNSKSDRYAQMVGKICEWQRFTSLKFQKLEDMIAAIGIDPDDVCTYCWNGKE